MAFYAPVKSGGGDFQLPEAGQHIAIITGLIHLGMQHNSQYNIDSDRLMFLFELTDDLLKEGEKKGMPLMVSKEFNNTMSKKSGMRTKFVELIDKPLNDEEAKNYDLASLLGKQIMITINHKNKQSDPSKQTWVINGFSQVHPKMYDASLKAVNPLLLFNLNNPDQKVFNSLPDWIKNKINLTGAKNVGSGDFA